MAPNVGQIITMTTEASTVSTDPGLERLKAQRAGHRGALTRYEKETLELICELETRGSITFRNIKISIGRKI